MPLRTPSRQRGLSVVELMVGVAVGLFVVAGAAMLVGTQLGDNRRLMIETQVQQDLRAAADIVARDLRRAGYWHLAPQALWVAGGSPAPVTENSLTTLTYAGGTPATEVNYSYWRTAFENSFGYKLESGVLRSRLSLAGWQELTDPRTLKVTRFEVVPQTIGTPIKLPCPRNCPPPAAADACWPTVAVRALQVTIEGEAANDPKVKRSVTTLVRLRNDVVDFKGPQICPI